MKLYKNIIIAVFLVFGVLDVMGQIDFNSCPGDVTKCNAFYPSFTCGNYSVRTMYGAPKLLKYKYQDWNNNEFTKQVVKLTGTKKIINNLKEDVDEGFEFEYLFAPNKGYVITIEASAYRDDYGSNTLADYEVIVGSQYSSQNTSGCERDRFDFQKNNGTVVFKGPPRAYYPLPQTIYFQSGSANVSKVKIRSVNTAVGTPDESSTNYQYVLIYSVTIAEGSPPPNPGGNLCEYNDTYITRGIVVDYATQPTWTYPSIEGSYHSTTASSYINIKNGTYRILSNHNIYLKPGFHATVGVNGNIQAVIGRCDGGEPLRMETNPNTEDKPNEPDLNNGSLLFPNPAKDELNLILKEQMSITQKFVFDNLGRKVAVKVKKVDGNKLTLDVSSLKSGVYYLSIVNKTSTKTYKFMVYR